MVLPAFRSSVLGLGSQRSSHDIQDDTNDVTERKFAQMWNNDLSDKFQTV